MAQDPTELVVAGTGALWIADFGIELPEQDDDDLEELGYEDLGLVTEDGLSFQYSPQVQEFFSWQLRAAVRRELTGGEYNMTFSLQQWNRTNMQTAFGGGEVTQVAPGHFRYDFISDTDQLADKSVVAEWFDGGRHFRMVLPRVNVTEGAELALSRTSLGLMPVSFKALAPGNGIATAFILTNDAAFAPVGS